MDNSKAYYKRIRKEYYQVENIEDWALLDVIKDLLKQSIADSRINLDILSNYAHKIGLGDFYVRPEKQSAKAANMPTPFDALENFIEEKEKLLDLNYISYEALMLGCLRKPEKAYTIKWGYLKEYQDEFNKLKKKVTDPFLKLSEELFDPAMEDILNISIKYLDMFFKEGGLIDEFTKEYQYQKHIRNYLDFNDLETYTIELLQPQYPIASLLNQQLKEVMVDEYQDTNKIQEKIIHLITDVSNPPIYHFIVGDMKQSIYRFRRADPGLFLEKYHQYPDKKDCVRIDMHYNYRSNKIVLDSINYLFNILMDKQIGSIEYYHDDNSQLNYDFLRKERVEGKEPEEYIYHARKRIHEETRFDTELLLFDNTNLELEDPVEYEAHLVALKMLDLMKNSTIDDNHFNPRPIHYRDMVVLMRSTVNMITFKKIFDLYHIPNHIVLTRGFYSSCEFQSIFALLKAIINPYDDISMLSVLRNNFAFSHFNEQDIYDLRLKYPDSTIYEALLHEEKYNEFMEVFKELLTLSNGKPSDLLHAIYHKTQYPVFVQGLVNGKQRKANLDLLMEEIISRNDQTMFEIVNDLEKMVALDSDQSPAMVVSANDDVVQFMTIHKSKGLEFPIVFVCSMNKKLNKEDIRSKVMINSDYGMAVKPRVFQTVDNIENVVVEYENPYHRALGKLVEKDGLDEEMRILYVALTRASQKIIMTGYANASIVKSWDQTARFNAKMPVYAATYRKVDNYLDWVGPAFCSHPDVIDSFSYGDIHLKNYRSINRMEERNVKDAKLKMEFYSKEWVYGKIEEQGLSYLSKGNKTYQFLPGIEKNDISKTIAVTKLIDEVAYERTYTQHLMSADKFGSLVHQFFEYLPLDEDNALGVIETYTKLGLWNELERQALLSYQKQIQGFMDSEIFALMKEADHVYKEKPFSFILENQQVIHGTFDVLCFKDKQLTIIDYKTDRIRSDSDEQTLIAVHHQQMDYYKELLYKIYPDYHIQAIVYYLEIGRYVII